MLCYTVDGVPFLYNGCEHCDTSQHSIFGNPGQFRIDRSNDRSERSAFLRKLSSLHRTEPAFRDGAIRWLKNSAPDHLCTYLREAPDGEKIFCAVNFGNEPVTADCPEFSGGEVLLARGAEILPGGLEIKSNGYMLLKKQP